MVYELERVLPVCDVFLCSMSATYDGAVVADLSILSVSLCMTLYPHCFSRLSCEMSTRWGQPCEGCSVL